MTFLQPSKNNKFYNRLLTILAIIVVTGIVSLIMIYNQVVTTEHEISQIKKQIEETRAASAELKDKIFSFLSGENLENLKEQKELIQDKNPDYFKISQKWVFATQY